MNKAYLHPLPIRIWHWLNALIILLLIITGIQLRIPDIRIFPSYHFVTAFHKYAGFALVGSFLFWLVSYLFTGGLARQYLLTFRDIKVMPKQGFYYMYGFFRSSQNPFKPSQSCKFNPLQKTAYLFVMFVFMPVIIITGILFSNIVYFLSIINLIGGIRILDTIHVIFGYFFVIYLIIHVYMSTLGERIFTHIKAMITGYAIEPEDHEEQNHEPQHKEPAV